MTVYLVPLLGVVLFLYLGLHMVLLDHRFLTYLRLHYPDRYRELTRFTGLSGNWRGRAGHEIWDSARTEDPELERLRTAARWAAGIFVVGAVLIALALLGYVLVLGRTSPS